MRVVDHVVAGRAGPERLLGPHVEAAAVELVQQAEAGRADRLRVGQPRDEVRTASARAARACVSAAAVGPTSAPSDSLRRGVCTVTLVAWNANTTLAISVTTTSTATDRASRVTARPANGRAACAPGAHELHHGPPDREQHERDERPRPQQQVEPDRAEDPRRRHEPEPERDDEHPSSSSSTRWRSRHATNTDTHEHDEQQRARNPRTRDLERATVAHERAREQLPRVELRQQHTDAAVQTDRWRRADG